MTTDDDSDEFCYTRDATPHATPCSALSAALARAEAAEKLRNQAIKDWDDGYINLTTLLAETRAEAERAKGVLSGKFEFSESRLAEATALLERGRSSFENRDVYLAWREDADAFLSATPAQAAEPAAVDDKRKPYDQGWLDGSAATAQELLAGRAQDDRLTAAVEALSAKLPSVGSEHPDTIALRECLRSREEYATALGATETALRECRAELEDTRERIAELELERTAIQSEKLARRKL